MAGVRTDIQSGTRYIAVISASQRVKDEWKKAGSDRTFVEVHKDYALMKVLYMLGIDKKYVSQGGVFPKDVTKLPRVPVRVFEYGEPVVPLDFSGLKDSDTIFIAGHGTDQGLYALGPDPKEGTRRLAEDILLRDGNLKKKRQRRRITILLLSCRAGLGFHKGLARRLLSKLRAPAATSTGHASIQVDGSAAINILQPAGPDVTIGGALGFTFGSMETCATGLNEVLIEGIPWRIEYPGSIPNDDADKKTSAREGKQITYEDKKAEIRSFKDKKKGLEKDMADIIGKLKSTEVNLALDELETRFGSEWLGLIQSQFELYQRAKTVSNLEFDMWYDHVSEGYVWTDGTTTTDAEADALLSGDLVPVGDGLTSTK